MVKTVVLLPIKKRSRPAAYRHSVCSHEYPCVLASRHRHVNVPLIRYPHWQPWTIPPAGRKTDIYASQENTFPASYNKLQMNALAIVSDSGTLPEESSFYLSIGHPIAAVCIRTSTERPEALEAGDFILAGITTDELLNATSMAIEMKRKGVLGKPCPDYVDETVSMKVVRIIQGYVGVVNKMVWRKS